MLTIREGGEGKNQTRKRNYRLTTTVTGATNQFPLLSLDGAPNQFPELLLDGATNQFPEMLLGGASN
ncbi:jg2457 [Pararge aegeria aegeria]|uniref:Jg2457 protein n=1 Tax=Pararge aegeria aegeria TaxID=348720 RepID=A0A8S4QJK2_9NEOP|nr:jg2457 [Pararge aegeria aegeria]